MRIGMVGGLNRNATALQAVAQARGHALEVHTGVIGSSAAAAALKAMIARSELVLVLTDVNSHNAVHVARQEARRRRRSLQIVRRMGPSQFAVLLQRLAASPLLQ